MGKAAQDMLADKSLTDKEKKKVKAIVEAMEGYKVVVRGFKLRLQIATSDKFIKELDDELLNVIKTAMHVRDGTPDGWSSAYPSAMAYQKWITNQEIFLRTIKAVVSKSTKQALKDLDRMHRH